MKKDVQFSEENFLSLMPVGKGFSTEKEMQGLTDRKVTDRINQARKKFQVSAQRKETKLKTRTSRAEKPFISKAWFILNHLDFTKFSNPDDVLLSLLADSATLFSRGYQVYATDHGFYRDLRSQHGKTKEDELQLCRNYALRNVNKEDRRRRYESILCKLEEKATQEGRQVTELEPELIFQIWESIPLTLKLEPEEISSFPLDVLLEYFSRARSIPAEKRAAGHYSASYRERDGTKYEEYSQQKERLKHTLQRHRSWKKEKPESIVDKNTEYRVDKGELKIEKDKTGQFSKIIEATKHYYVAIKEQDISNNVQYIIDQIQSLDSNDNSTFPFHYFMVCIAGTMRMLTKPWTVKGEKVLKICADQCSIHKQKEQRKQRIQFLHELNIACKLNREDRSRNWNLFLSVHGTQIQSKEESDLWEKILYDGVPQNGNKETNEDIPVIELTLLCLERLKECLPDRLENLYCYRPASFMHQGGFAEFLKQHPKVLDDCVRKIQQKDWKGYTRRYLREWTKLECNRAAIQALCSERAGIIRWGSISESFNRELENFQKEDVRELKSLLVEAAFQKSLNCEAAAILAKQAEKILNRGSDYKIFLTDLPWS